VKGDLTSAQADLAGKESLLTETQAALTEARLKVDALTAQLNDAKAAEEAAENDLTGAQADLAGKAALLEETQAALTEAQKKVDDLTAQLSAAETSLGSVQTDLTTAQAELEDKTTQLARRSPRWTTPTEGDGAVPATGNQGQSEAETLQALASAQTELTERRRS
jgi:chromosome segregation ATPase